MFTAGCYCWVRLHRIAQSIDLLLACYVANATCTTTVVMTTLIFIIVSHSHAFLLVVIIHAPVAVEVILYFQHNPAAQSNDFMGNLRIPAGVDSKLNKLECCLPTVPVHASSDFYVSKQN